MFGLSIIKTAKLRKMESLDNSFKGIIGKKDETIKALEFKVENLTKVNEKLTRKRNEKGQFVKQ